MKNSVYYIWKGYERRMNVYFLGEYIKKQREKLGLIQEQVCEGICEQVTLSRLENGRQTPSRTRVNALLQRLGLPEDRYYMILTKNELEIEALKKRNHRVQCAGLCRERLFKGRAVGKTCEYGG